MGYLIFPCLEQRAAKCFPQPSMSYLSPESASAGNFDSLNKRKYWEIYSVGNCHLIFHRNLHAERNVMWQWLAANIIKVMRLVVDVRQSRVKARRHRSGNGSSPAS